MNRFITLQLSWRIFRKEWKSLPVLFWMASLFFASIICTGLVGFTETMENRLKRDTAVLFGGDLVVSSNRSIPPAFQEQADALTLKNSASIEFFSMIQAKEDFRLASIKGVSDTYPLLGGVELGADREKQYHGPVRGTIWIVSELVSALGLSIGDRVQIGEAHFTFSNILFKEPDVGGGTTIFAPRILMHLDDVSETGIVQPASRLQYRLAIVGTQADIAKYRRIMTPFLNEDIRFVTPNTSSRALQSVTKNTKRFMSIAILTTLLLTGLAILIATRNYALSHQQHVGILKAFGLSPNQINSIFLFVFLWNSFFAIMLGILLSYMVFLLKGVELSIWPAVLSLFLGALIVFAFGYPLLSRLKNLSPMVVLTQGNTLSLSNSFIPMAGIFFVLMIGLYFYLGQVNLLAIIGLSLLYGGVIIMALYHLFLYILKKTLPLMNARWRVGFRHFISRGQEDFVQIFVFTLIFACINLNQGLLNDVLKEWVNDLPPETPNYFVVNLAPQHVAAFRGVLKTHDVQAAEIYPIVRGRLTHINGQPTNRIGRALNMTWSNVLPKDNKVLVGPNWSMHQSQDISVEQDVASRLGLRIGDKLRFSIDDEVIEGTVFHFRSVEWESFNPNFFFIFDKALLGQFPYVAMSSFYLPDEKKVMINQIVRSFPEVSVVDVAELIQAIQSLMGKLVNSLTILLTLLSGIGLCAWGGSLWLSLREREKIQALFSAMGASRLNLSLINLTEFGMMGLFVGVLSFFIGSEVCALVSEHFFRLPYRWSVSAGCLHIGMILGFFLCVGLMFTHHIQRVSPIQLLSR